MGNLSMEPGEYDALVAKARRGNNSAAIALLQAMRTHKIRQPELVLMHGGKVLRNCPGKLGDELWAVHEQVFMAAVELGNNEWQDHCLQQLTKKFPVSIRVERLKGLREEGREHWDEAKKIYTKIINDKPEDVVARKRLITIFRQRGKLTEAIEQVNAYLDIFSTDAEVWHELADLYIEAGSIQRALFCFEELIASNPRSIYHILTYAELLYSTGDYELSRKYYCLAAYLDGTNLRALWGLLAVNMQLAEKDKANNAGKVQANNLLVKLQPFAKDRLRAAYTGVGPHGASAIALLKSCS